MSEVSMGPTAPLPGPTRQPGDPRPHHKRRRNSLAAVADIGRQYPRQWVFCGTTNAKASELEWRFVSEVTEGDKSTLGGLTEQWDAQVERGVVRNGEPVILGPAGVPQPGEHVTMLKYIAYLGPRERSTVPTEPPVPPVPIEPGAG